MPAPIFQYAVYHPITRRRMGSLDVRDAKWSEVVSGSGTFSGSVTVPDDATKIAMLKQLTDPYKAAVYATYPDRNLIMWGGPIVSRKWDSNTNTLSFTAMTWRAWLYSVILGPKPDGTGTNTFSYTNTEQLLLARIIFQRTLAEGYFTNGIPLMDAPEVASTGITRNYQISGMNFKSPAAYLDELAALDRGFEWDLVPFFDQNQDVICKLQTYFPQQGGVVPALRFSKTPEGGNILDVEDIEYDATSAAKRVWAVGDGPNAESTPWAQDMDPDLAYGVALRTDVASTYSAVTRATLASYARAERLYRNDTLNTLGFTVRMDAPDVFSYGKGDRCQVTVRDRFLSLDVTKCRIVSREFDADAGTVKLTVNLNDLKAPEVDTGGSV